MGSRLLRHILQAALSQSINLLCSLVKLDFLFFPDPNEEVDSVHMLTLGSLQKP